MFMPASTRNPDCRVILAEDRDVSLRDLLPRHWLDDDDTTEP
jgi:hypothetical protein